ncbi:Hypothetical predicted protein [Pelobates cultripes]|uniref:Uncharacterized protein n=1 Tax=Pelobates cultripes TaxID=61616 RepID=A0AAD1RUV1_PELCU|nr:Hypothetical predicted protein [Pelobates cultripes]
MESNYDRLKRTTLKDLLESRGGTASNRHRRELIAELTKLDQSFTVAEPRVPPRDEKTRIVREKLLLFGPNPSEERIIQIMAYIDAEIQAAKEYEIRRITISTPQSQL